MAWNKPLIFFLLFIFGIFTSKAQDDAMSDGTVDSPSAAFNFLTGRGWKQAGEASEIVSFEDLMRDFQRYTGLPVTGMFDEATKDKMNSPHCGNSDFSDVGYSFSSRKRRYTTLGTSWSQNVITWRLENNTPDLHETIVRAQLQRAFQLFADVSPLRFSEVTTRNADIIVKFARREHGDGNSFDGEGSTLAHAYRPGPGIGGDVHFDDDETFSTSSNRINFFQVATHEIGHSLGLGHTDVTDAVMAPFYVYRRNFALHSDDIRGIQSLYGPPVSNPTTRPPIPTQRTTTRPPLTTTPPRTLPPIHCNGQFDAATESFDNNVYLFQGNQIFKVRHGFGIMPGYPRPISEELKGSPTFVDAAFLWTVNEQNKYIYIFKGGYYWRFYNGVASFGYPRPISNWHLPVVNIDAVFQWPGNDRIYFIKDDKYYRYNVLTYRIDPGYPRSLGIWNNVYAPVSAVLDVNSRTYFFSDQYFQFFYDDEFSASDRYEAARSWLGCRTEGLGLLETTEIPTTILEDDDGSDGSVTIPSISVVLVTSFFALWHHVM